MSRSLPPAASGSERRGWVADVGSDGRTVPVIVPWYVNPVLAGLVLCAVTLTVLAVVRSKGRSTPRDRAETPGLGVREAG
ncbi:hypothetical protein [Streptomyces sp. CBMA156]|uniref:hypothetical protein n=1 Tax=Streptomyces sp. CBMA156 TaxID=1930280 RepID=UPI001661C417|nr:hypothetical protein [Streptomyces sp. CBMA156]